MLLCQKLWIALYESSSTPPWFLKGPKVMLSVSSVNDPLQERNIYRCLSSLSAWHSDCKTTMLIYALVTEGVPCWFMGVDSRFSDLASVCVRMVYLYIQCVWRAVKASTGSSIMLCMAHMSGALLLCSFTPRHCWGDHISMCGCSVIHWCSVWILQDTFLGLPITLLEFRGGW